MKKLVLALALCGGLAGAARAATDWGDFAWLEGRWTGYGGGAPGQAIGGFSFTPQAQGQVLVRRNYADYPAQNGKPAQHHEDLMVIYREGEAVRATYWDGEGQTIHYAVSAPEAGEAVFLSDDPKGPRFRLSYHRTPAGLEGRFEVAPPPGRDQFKTYLTWTGKRTAAR